MKTATAWTEASLQNHIAKRFNRSGSLCVPNCNVLGWESDLIRVSSRLFVSEYEIKISRSDFRADAKKQWRLSMLEDGSRGPIYRSPNRFWYVAPRGVIPVEEVPPYAGLLEIYEAGHQDIVKKAPKIHGDPLPLRHVLYLTRGCAIRYWSQRSECKQEPTT